MVIRVASLSVIAFVLARAVQVGAEGRPGGLNGDGSARYAAMCEEAQQEAYDAERAADALRQMEQDEWTDSSAKRERRTRSTARIGRTTTSMSCTRITKLFRGPAISWPGVPCCGATVIRREDSRRGCRAPSAVRSDAGCAGLPVVRLRPSYRGAAATVLAGWS